MHSHPRQQSIILARHGQTTWNLDGRYQGQSDAPLCPIGVMECAELAGRLRGTGIGSIYTSPLNRARQTAQILADRLQIETVEDDPRLAEINFGQWEGLTQSQVRQRWPALLKTWKSVPDAVRFPGGETLHEARGRLRSFLQDIASQSTPHGGGVLIVTHTGLIRLAVLDARLQKSTLFRQVPVAPASIWHFVLLATDSDLAPVLQLTDSSTGTLPARASDGACCSHP
ncbi:MAG: histidine phosphatase family protein [Steroidobacteraceae bacterium]